MPPLGLRHRGRVLATDFRSPAYCLPLRHQSPAETHPGTHTLPPRPPTPGTPGAGGTARSVAPANPLLLIFGFQIRPVRFVRYRNSDIAPSKRTAVRKIFPNPLPARAVQAPPAPAIRGRAGRRRYARRARLLMARRKFGRNLAVVRIERPVGRFAKGSLCGPAPVPGVMDIQPIGRRAHVWLAVLTGSAGRTRTPPGEAIPAHVGSAISARLIWGSWSSPVGQCGRRSTRKRV